MNARPPARLILATAQQPGAVAILQRHGPGAVELLARLTQRRQWPLGKLILADLGGIDQGLAVVLREDWAELMPHGGLRVVQKLMDALVALGATIDADADPRRLYPEADSDIEADALAMIARAASPAAVDLLLAQPRLWQRLLEAGPLAPEQRDRLLKRSHVLNRLIEPPWVVVVGRPNVGKSTLTNRMLGSGVSVVADLPGTTRDWVSALAELPARWRPVQAQPPQREAAWVAVRWLDTPGLRQSDDPLEQQAIELAHQVLERADVLVAMRDPATDWPEPQATPRPPQVWVMNKIDDLPEPGLPPSSTRGTRPDDPLPISAAHERGLDALQRVILDRLGLAELDDAEPWAFSPTLRDALQRGDEALLRRYVSG
ncbi:MAG TPA: GTPase [Phycisphaeraceae bacterium]